MAIDWAGDYGLEFEYWEVDPRTFKDSRRLYLVNECEITRDFSDDTLGGATMSLDEMIASETYLRAYLVVQQPPGSGKRERVELGTFLAQTPKVHMDGKSEEIPLDLYTPLKELADDKPPVGYTVRKGDDAVKAATRAFSRHHVRVLPSSVECEVDSDVVAGDSDSWLTFGRAVLSAADMEPRLTPHGEVYFAPVRDASAMAESWTYADDAISILTPEADLECDWHGVPNVYEVVVSEPLSTVAAECENADPSSPVSTASRGRVVRERETNPDGVTTREQAEAHARRKLREMSCAERELTYTHGFCPVELGDCVRVRYKAHSLDCKARVTRQVIRCQTDLEVEETASFTERLWNG